jgi:hypothetical protein
VVDVDVRGGAERGRGVDDRAQVAERVARVVRGVGEHGGRAGIGEPIAIGDQRRIRGIRICLQDIGQIRQHGGARRVQAVRERRQEPRGDLPAADADAPVRESDRAHVGDRGGGRAVVIEAAGQVVVTEQARRDVVERDPAADLPVGGAGRGVDLHRRGVFDRLRG